MLRRLRVIAVAPLALCIGALGGIAWGIAHAGNILAQRWNQP